MNERRNTLIPDGLAVQRAKESDPARIVGYGAVFYRAGDAGTEYWLWDDIVERIMPGAFDRAIREDDVRSFFNHDANIVLGRNKAGTLDLSIDAVGLRYDIKTPDTQLVRDQVLGPISRGDVSGSSFMFCATKTAWIEEKREGGGTLYIREVQECQLYEVGPVVFPAYEGATSGTRCLRAFEPVTARSQFEQWRNARERQRVAVEADLAAFRDREIACE